MPVSLNMPSSEIVLFSPCGSLVSVSTGEGRLAVWAVGGTGGSPHQQYLPANHLEATTSSLAWQPSPPAQPATPGSKKKKKKDKHGVKEPEDRGFSSDLQALGTSAGTVLLYSVKQGDLVASMKKENNSKINAITWSNNGCHIFAAAEDGNVSQFSAAKMCHLSSFPVSPGSPLTSVCVSPGDDLLATAAHTISLFSLQPAGSSTPQLLATFSGHANPVTCLAFTPGGLLASAASVERTVQLWETAGGISGGSCLLSLACNEGVRSLSAVEEGVTVVTEGGSVLVFRLPQGVITKKKKPLKPGSRLVVSSPRDPVSGKVAPLPVLAARLKASHTLGLVYGSPLHPVTEVVELSELKDSESLVRELPLAKVGGEGGEFNAVVTPRTDGDVTFLAPGVSQPLGPGQGKLGKRKQSAAPAPSQDSLPIQERVSLLGSQAGEDSSRSLPRTDTLAQLLTQGLHSSDSRILNSVLDRADPELIDNTVRLLPAEAVVPLISTLQKYIKGRGVVNASHAKWLKSVLTLHTGYLVSIPDCQDLLGPVYALLERRTSHYSQVLQLRGKLELLTKQTDAKEGDKIVDTDKEALLVYQDDSSDELENVIDDLLVPGSGSDDQWTDEDENDKEIEADEDSDSDVEIVNGDADSDEEMESEED